MKKKLDEPQKTKNINRKKIIFCLVFLAFITFLTYIPSLKNGFTNWDDGTYVTENKLIRNLSLKNIEKIFTVFVSNNYHPLTILSLAVEYKFFKLKPFIYHFNNLFLHVFNTLLVFWFIFLISDKVLISFIVSLFFALHPMHVESVAWISERKDVLYAFFYLLSLIVYIYYVKNNKIKNYILSFILFIVSLLSKSMAVTLPAVLFIVDFILKRKFRVNLILEKIPFIILTIIFSSLAVYSQQAISDGTPLYYSSDVFKNIRNALNGIVFYIIKLTLPLKLSNVYPHPDKIGGFISEVVSFSPLIVFFIIAIVLFSFNWSKIVFFGSVFFLVTILPVLHIIPVGRAIPADRYTYIPSIGYFYIIAEGILYLWKKFDKSKVLKTSLIVLTMFIIIFYSVSSWKRCMVWKDSLTLWLDAYTKYKNYEVIQNNVGNAYFDLKDYNTAIKYFTESVNVNPDFAEGYNNRANTYCRLKEFDKALQDYQKALQINPNYANVYHNMGNVYGDLGDFEKAISCYNKAIDINPKFVSAYYNRAVAYYMLKKYDKAWESIIIIEKMGEIESINSKLLELLKEASKK